MPELPEVETIRRGLAGHIPGRIISKVEISKPKLVISHLSTSLQEDISGQKYTSLRRLGKILIVDLERTSLLIRLGMTGQLTFRDTRYPDDSTFDIHPITGLQRASQHAPDKHTHIVIEHSDGTFLCYRDIRMFGRWIAYPSSEVDKAPELLALGPDPILAPQILNAHLRSTLAKTSRAIKVVLLDQAVVCGLGNIYVDEALFACSIRPMRPANSLNISEIANLAEYIPIMLQRAISNRGTTFSDYRDSDGNPGHNQESLKVYGRYGQACYRCGTTLERSTIGGRTSSWCPKCQK